MSLSPTSRQIILQEVFDEASLPTDEEIHDYALRIGIDIENEPHLLYLARDGLMQALPAGWKPCFDKDKKEIYYFNFKTKKAQWEHPLDDVYRNLVKKARTEAVSFSEQVDDDSRTSLKEDLKSFEEASLILNTNEMYTKIKKLEPLSPLGKGALKKVSTIPLKKSNSKDYLKGNIINSPLHIDEEKLMQKSEFEHTQKKLVFDETEVRKRPNSSDIRNRRNIGPVEFRHLTKQEIITSHTLEKLNFFGDTKKLMENKESPSMENKGSESVAVTKDEGYGTEFSVSSLGGKDTGKKELTLAGGGSVFLKNNKMKSSPSSDLVTSSFSKEELSDGLLSPDVRKSGSEIDSHPKSILRDQTTLKLTERCAPSLVEKKIRKEDFDDERKSVRFNLEKELKITFEIPPPANSDSDENQSTSFRKSVSNKKVRNIKEKEEVRQIEVDFDDLEIDLSDEKIVKEEKKMEEKKSEPKTEPKQFRPSQALVNEFREIFDLKPKNKINLLVNKFEEKVEEKIVDVKSSRSSSSRSLSSQSERSQKSTAWEDRKSNRDNLIDLSESKESNGKSVEKSKINELDITFDNLVDFALKKKLEINSDENLSEKKISYREKDHLLDEILKADSESFEVSDDEKLFESDEKELKYLEKIESQINLSALKRKELEAAENYEKLQCEKSEEIEKKYNLWLEDLEKSYEEKKKKAMESLKEKHKNWLKKREEEFKEMQEEKSQSKLDGLREEFLKKENEEMKKLRKQLEDEQKERLQNLKLEIEEKEKKELDLVRKSFEENLSEKKKELFKKHKEEIEKIDRNLEDLLSEKKAQKLKELELARENEAVIEVMRLEMKESYQKQKNNLMKEHELLLENLRQEHALAVEQLKIELKNEEESLRKSHLNRLDEIKMRIEVTEGKRTENLETTRSDTAEARVFEKVRCEKRLLEDKYKTLKEKYIRLKTEAKSTLERKKKKKEGAATGSETEKSSSHKMSKSEHDSPNVKRKSEVEKKFKLRKLINNLDDLYLTVSTEEEENQMSPKNLPHTPRTIEGRSLEYGRKLKLGEKSVDSPTEGEKSKEESSGEEKKAETETKKKRQLFSRFKAASTSKINSNKSQNKETLSPVENLRRQLKKLEELEDQFPVNTHTDTYMRYPFTDNPQFGSSEIEFFKHRIHLERESVRRAKDSLKAQKKSFENRQKELKQKLIEGDPGTKSVIDQVYQEEKELTDMEVSVHRTRALLGEKIIRLRHLEQSLKRISQPTKKESFSMKSKDLLGRLGVRNQNKEEDRTLSDLSSYSGSSGFSSTDFNDVHNVGGGRKGLEQNRRHFQSNIQESSEIIQSLENLNSEIREIWEVLKKQHQSGLETITMLPPPPLIYGDLGWPGFTLPTPVPYRNTVITSTSNMQRAVGQQFKTQVSAASNLNQVSAAVESSIIDRTKSLRDWLRAARSSSAPAEVISPSQVTL